MFQGDLIHLELMINTKQKINLKCTVLIQGEQENKMIRGMKSVLIQGVQSLKLKIGPSTKVTWSQEKDQAENDEREGDEVLSLVLGFIMT